MFGIWRPRLNVDDVPCPTNDELRQMALAAVDARDPKRRLLDLLDEACKFAPPKWLIEKEMRAIWRLLETRRKAGQLDSDDVGKSERQLRSEYRVIAERRVRLGLVIAEIGRRNNIVPLERATTTPSQRATAYENEVVDLIFALAAAGG